MRTGQPPVSPRRSVALLIETSNRYSRELLQGIRDFMRKQGNWTVHLTEHGRGDVPPAWLRSWDGDGVIVRIENRRMERAVRRLGVPVINVSASGIADDFPSVISDSEAIARLAAEHLIERGFRHFGYCGDARFAWSKTARCELHARPHTGWLQMQPFRFAPGGLQRLATRKGTTGGLDKAAPQTGGHHDVFRHSRPTGDRCLPRAWDIHS